MLVPLNVNKLWQRISGKTQTNPVNVVAQRFLQAFHGHGVEAAQIPRLLSQIKLDDLRSEDALLAVLNPDVLDQTAQLFGIRSQWLEGVDDEIYEYRGCCKQPEHFFEYFVTLQPGSEDLLAFPVRALTTTKNLDCSDSGEQLLALVLVEQIARLGDEPVYRYHVYRDGWDWSYTPSRIQLKAMVRVVCKKLHTIAPLFVVTLGEMEEILSGRIIPRKFLTGCQITNPSLEDFVLTKQESIVAKEVDELPEVLMYIEEYKLENLVTVEPSRLSPLPTEPTLDIPQEELPTVVSVNSNAVKAANASHARKNAIKKRFIEFHQSQGNSYPSKADSVRHFFNNLTEKEKLEFASKDAAIRTLKDALRNHLKEVKSSE